MLATWALVLAVILQLLLVHMVLTMQYEMTGQRDTLATKQDLVNLVTNIGPENPSMAVLDASCLNCHSRDRIASAHGIDTDASQVVDRMMAIPGSDLNGSDALQVTAALTYLKCTHCHEVGRLKELAILSPAERWEVIRGMSEKAGSTITPQDARRIRDFYGDFWGWHSR